jgi:hypothetical protein
VDCLIVSTIVEFVVMVISVHHAYTDKMLNKSMEVIVVLNVAFGIS